MSNLLVIDVGTSSTRVALASADGSVLRSAQRVTPPDVPFAGLVEFDAAALASLVLELSAEVLDGEIATAVGITNQRASTIMWDPATGAPVGPAQGWQDLRTVGECMGLGAEGWRLAPNHSATKIANLLDAHDPDRSRGLLFGTVDTWLAWMLSDGAAHITDLSNASATGLLTTDGTKWDSQRLERLNIPADAMPLLVASYGSLATASALPGSPTIAALAGDQSASLVGQACVQPGMAKATFGTGAMVDVLVGASRSSADTQTENGTAPLVAWGAGAPATPQWMTEGIVLTAGTNISWLVEDLGILDSPADATAVAAACDNTDGVAYVPALNGLGTPRWDFGARGALLGMTRGTSRPHIVRAVLEGVAHRGADLVEASRLDTGHPLTNLRVDGGMSVNPVFIQALADATGATLELSPVAEGTTRGAALLAACGSGLRDGLDGLASTWEPREIVQPGIDDDVRTQQRERWSDAVDRAAGWHGDLSAISF